MANRKWHRTILWVQTTRVGKDQKIAVSLLLTVTACQWHRGATVDPPRKDSASAHLCSLLPN